MNQENEIQDDKFKVDIIYKNMSIQDKQYKVGFLQRQSQSEQD